MMNAPIIRPSLPAVVRPALENELDRFFNQINHVPLLSKEEEQSLAVRIAGGDQEARRMFIKANMRLVVSIATRFVRPTLPLDDLVQEGTIGLMHAVDKFDYRKGFKFSTYATWWIRQAIMRSVDVLERPIQIPVHISEDVRVLRNLATQMEAELDREPTEQELAARAGLDIKKLRLIQSVRTTTTVLSLDESLDASRADSVTLADFLEDPDTDIEDEVLDFMDERVLLRKALALLPPREADVLRRRNGIDREPQTLTQAGDDLNITRERVRQIEAVAMTKLKQAIKKLMRERERWCAA